ncbi:MAG: type II toxin-antitoxin system MqsA family antitoxin [Methanosarcinaceae archaeon]
MMKTDRCTFCKGKLVKGETEFVVKVGEKVLAVKDVSAYVCEECGEAYYIPEVSEKIDGHMKIFNESTLLVHPMAAGELSMGESVA